MYVHWDALVMHNGLKVDITCLTCGTSSSLTIMRDYTKKQLKDLFLRYVSILLLLHSLIFTNLVPKPSSEIYQINYHFSWTFEILLSSSTSLIPQIIKGKTSQNLRRWRSLLFVSQMLRVCWKVRQNERAIEANQLWFQGTLSAWIGKQRLNNFTESVTHLNVLCKHKRMLVKGGHGI